MKFILFILFLIGFNFQMNAHTLEKRSPPQEIPAVRVGGYEFSLHTHLVKKWLFFDYWQCDLVANQDNKIIWQEQVYSNRLKSDLERDAQLIYPKSLKAHIGKLFGTELSVSSRFEIITEDLKTYYIKYPKSLEPHQK